MADYKRVTITLPVDLNERWGNVAKRLKMSKSGMVKDFLEEVIPILEQEKPKDIMKMALKKTSQNIELTASLFDDD